uniref:Uncharacterized protein n=1 Tax=Trichobilharzia regenti TaxID=157069 RepID=A0AA85JY32_TRIRE|nr:unnamed protein product [Trichobilharzia regenti]
MSNQISTLATWKPMYANKTSNRFLNFFIWMLVDAFLMLLVTLGMVIMVNTVGLSEWIEKHYFVSYIFIFIGLLPILLLLLLKRFRYPRMIDHLLISLSFILIAMGFAAKFQGIDWIYALISCCVTIVITGFMIVLALLLRNLKFQYTLIILIVSCVLAGVGIIIFLVELLKIDKFALELAVALCMIIFTMLVIFLTINRLRFCISFNEFYCTIIFRAFCIWIEMLFLFSSVYMAVEAIANEIHEINRRHVAK